MNLKYTKQEINILILKNAAKQNHKKRNYYLVDRQSIDLFSKLKKNAEESSINT